MLDQATGHSENTHFEDLFGAIDAFVYRCDNDDKFTMRSMTGAVASLTGHPPGDIIGNARVAYADLIAPSDQAAVDKAVEVGLKAREAWDVFYHLRALGGALVPVRERGCGVYDGGLLVGLKGMVVDASAEAQLIQNNAQMLEKTSAANAELIEATGEIISSLKALNILSVNANIEAARSGTAGAGFAVVADAIKKLADRNRHLAAQIQEKLQKAEAVTRSAQP